MKKRLVRQKGLAAISMLSPVLAVSFFTDGFPDAPIICLFKRLTTLPCPACGVTAAFFQLGAGGWEAAFALNAAAPLFYAAFWLASILAFAQLSTGKNLLGVLWRKGKRAAFIVFSAALAFAWAANLWARFVK